MDKDVFNRAVRSYWTVRESQAAKQLLAGKTDAGARGAVTGGAQLDVLAEVFAEVFIDAGLSPDVIRRSAGIELPGYLSRAPEN